MKRKVAIIIALAAVLIVVLGVMSLRGTKTADTVNVTEKYQAPGQFDAVAPYGQDTMVFSNDRSFVAYNYREGGTRLLSPDSAISGLQHIDTLSVSDDLNFLVFHGLQAPAGSALAAAMNAAGRADSDSVGGTWWVYNVREQTFRPLAASTVMARVHGDKLYTLGYGGSSEFITTLDPASLKAATRVTVPPSSNFFVAKDTYLLQTTDNSVLSTRDGVTSRTLASNTTLLGLTPDSSTALGVVNHDSLQDLVRIDTASGDQQTIAAELSAQPAWSPNGAVLYTTGDTQSSGGTNIVAYDTMTKKQRSWHIDTSVNADNKPALLPVALLDTGAAMVRGTTDEVYLVGSQLHPIKTVGAPFTRTFNVRGVTAQLTYIPNTQSFLVTTPPGDAPLKQTYDELRAAGLNPYLCTIQFSSQQGD